jgi:hypothetical protein
MVGWKADSSVGNWDWKKVARMADSMVAPSVVRRALPMAVRKAERKGLLSVVRTAVTRAGWWAAYSVAALVQSWAAQRAAKTAACLAR